MCSLFSTCTDRVVESTVGRRFSGVSFGDERFTDLDFSHDTVMSAETMGELDALARKSEILGLRVSWTKIKHLNTVD